MDETRKTAVKVGFFVLVSVLIFVMMLLFFSRWQTQKSGFTVKVKFGFLNNLSVNAPVKVAGGLNIGYVSKIYQEDLQTYVDIFLNKELENRIPERPETIITIYSSSLMGQKYVNVVIPPVTEGDQFLSDQDEWIGVDPPSIDQMMLAFSSWFNGKSGGEVLAEIMQQTQLFISNLNAIASENRSDIRMTVKQAKDSFAVLAQQLDELMGKLTLLSTNFTDISTRNKQDIEIMLQNLSQISREMNIITQRINSGRGTVGKFISDDDLYNNANETLAAARDLLRKLKEDPWRLLYKE